MTEKVRLDLSLSAGLAHRLRGECLRRGWRKGGLSKAVEEALVLWIDAHSGEIGTSTPKEFS